MAKKWYQDKDGGTSAMRLIAMMATVTGCVGVIFGGVIIVIGFPEGAQLATVSAGMAGLGEISKAWQSSRGS